MTSTPHQLYYVEKGMAALSLIDNGYGSRHGLYEIGIEETPTTPWIVKGYLNYDDIKRIIQKFERNPERDWEWSEGFY